MIEEKGIRKKKKKKLKGKGQEREKGKEKTLIFESLYLATQCRKP